MFEKIKQMQVVTEPGVHVTVIMNGKVYTKFLTHADTKELNLYIDSYNYQTLLERDGRFLNNEEIADKILELIDPTRRKKIYSGEFETDGNDYFLANSIVPVPKKLRKHIDLYAENGYDLGSLAAFWKLCLQNPNETARQDLFKFVIDHEMPITTHGYFMAYKSVLPKFDDDFVKFIKENAETASAKKIAIDELYVMQDNNRRYYLSFIKPEELNFDSYEEGEEEGDALIYNDTYVGTLKELYDAIQKGNTLYTDIHSRTMTIGVNKVVKMQRKQCDSNPQRDCSYGLHVGNVQYVNSFGSGSHGRQVLLCLVNPMHVVAVPEYDSSKMRTCEYYVYGISEMEGDRIKPIEVKYFESDYMAYELFELNELLASNDFSDYNPEFVDEVRKIVQERIVKIQRDGEVTAISGDTKPTKKGSGKQQTKS